MNDKVSAVEMRACATCKFSELVRMSPQDLTRVRVCRRFPPVPIMASQQNGNIGIAAVSPIVADSTWCHEYAPEGAANG